MLKEGLRALNNVRIAIERQHLAVGRIENGPAVTSRAEGAVDITRPITGLQDVDNVCEKHGSVAGRSASG